MACAAAEALQQVIDREPLPLCPGDIQHNGALRHHQGAAAQRQGLRHVVGHHQTGDAVLRYDAPGQLQHLVRRGGVQCRRVLVQQQQLRRHHGGHQQRQRLPLTAGQQPHRLAHPLLQPHVQLGQLAAEQLPVLGRDAAEGASVGGSQIGQRQILLDGHVGSGPPHGVLKQPPNDPAALVLRLEGQIRTVQQDTPLVGVKAPGNGPKQGGLPGAVGAYDGGELPVLQMQGELPQSLPGIGRAGVEGLGNGSDIQHIRRPPFGYASASGKRPSAADRGRQWPAPQ